MSWKTVEKTSGICRKITIDYAKECKAFGNRIIDFQNTQFKLTEMKTEPEIMKLLIAQSL